MDDLFSTLHAQLQKLRLCAQGIYFHFQEKWVAWKIIGLSTYFMLF